MLADKEYTIADDQGLSIVVRANGAKLWRTSERITANARIYSETIAMTADDRVMIAPPFTHVFGLCCVADAICYGATTVLLPLYTPADYVQTIAAGRPTVLFTAPAHVAAALKGGVLDHVDLSTLREVVIDGSVCPLEVAKALEDRMPTGALAASSA